MKGRKTGGRDFKPGQSGNPNGRPKLPEEVKEAKRLTAAELELKLTEFLKKSREELYAIAKDPKSTGMDALVASIMTFGVSKGDHMRMEFLLNRLIGKVKEQVNVEGGFKVVVEDYTK